MDALSTPVVFVIGASGKVGSATLRVLAAKYSEGVEIRAGVRNPNTADNVKTIDGVNVVKAEMGTARDLENTLKGVHSLFIVTPATQNRAELTIETAKSAKKAGVKFQVIVSALTADCQDTLFGQQIEAAIKDLGVTYTFLRLPLFFENYLGFKDTIKDAGAIYTPVDPYKTFSPVTVGDIGNAAATVLVYPERHANKTYTIISDSHSFNDVAEAFGEALGSTVTCIRIPYDAARQATLEMGYPEWLVEEIMELYKLIDGGDPAICTTSGGDYKLITGEEPTNLRAWITQVKGVFEW